MSPNSKSSSMVEIPKRRDGLQRVPVVVMYQRHEPPKLPEKYKRYEEMEVAESVFGPFPLTGLKRRRFRILVFPANCFFIN